MTVEDEKIAALRSEHAEKLNTVRAELQTARESLSERKSGYDAERDKYERLSRRMLTPLQNLQQGTGSIPSMPAAAHGWLQGEAKAPLSQAQAALRQVERQIESLEQDVNKWADEVAYLDRVLVGDKVSMRLVGVPKPKAPTVDYDNILMPREAAR